MEKILTYSLSVFGALLLSSVNLSASVSPESLVELRTKLDRPLLSGEERDQKVVVRIEVEGAEVERLVRAPLNLAIVLDRSGSMSGAKLEQAKQAALMLVDQLDEDDILSLVLYESEVEVAVHAGPLGKRRSEIKRAIRRIETGGSTALYDGVAMGGCELEEFLSDDRINRIMLLSDGIANVGPSSNREIANLGTRLSRKGLSVTTIGLGNDYNETLMTALAEASDANYYYVADVEALPEVFRNELGELKSVIARNLEIEIRCPKGVRPLRFLGRPGELKSREESLVFGTLSSSQTREIYFECLVERDAIGDITEIVELEARFSEVASGKESVVSATPVVVGYSDDVKLVEKSINEEVVAESIIWANAVETERSIALADEGKFEESRANIASQKAALTKALPS
ncbi:MAG: VWA domain-containing protein, partial [Verrucomicrobiota bacterium]